MSRRGKGERTFTCCPSEANDGLVSLTACNSPILQRRRRRQHQLAGSEPQQIFPTMMIPIVVVCVSLAAGRLGQPLRAGRPNNTPAEVHSAWPATSIVPPSRLIGHCVRATCAIAKEHLVSWRRRRRRGYVSACAFFRLASVDYIFAVAVAHVQSLATPEVGRKWLVWCSRVISLSLRFGSVSPIEGREMRPSN